MSDNPPQDQSNFRKEEEESKSRGRYRLKKNDNQSPRFECFCKRQYLSYPAIYWHIKTKHRNFYEVNKNFCSTNVVETTDPIHNYRIRKVLPYPANGEIPQQNAKNQTQSKQNRRVQEVQYQGNSEHLNHLQLKLSQVMMKNQEQERRMRIYRQVLENWQVVMQHYQAMVTSYESILKTMNIRIVSETLQDQQWNEKQRQQQKQKCRAGEQRQLPDYFNRG